MSRFRPGRLVATCLFAVIGMLAAGATASAQSAVYTYDSLNRLTRIVYADGTTVVYSYDAAGNRMTKTVTDPCVYTLSTATLAVATAGGTGSVNLTTAESCSWTAISNANFITVTAGESGTGNGTVTIGVSANDTGAERVGTLTIAGHTFTVTQAGHVAPAITTPPTNLTVTAGQDATFSVVASGTPAPTYRWQVSVNNGTSFTDLSDTSPYSGVTTPTLTIAAASVGLDQARYRVVATNIVDGAISAAATLTVHSAPAITTSPVSQTVISGQNTSFTVVATGNPAPTYRWQMSLNNGASFTDVPDASPYSDVLTATLNISSASPELTGHQYRVVVTNVIDTATSTAATLTVQSAPVITLAPVSQTVTEGHTVVLSAAATGTPTPTYRWQVSTEADGGFANVSDGGVYSGALTDTLTISGVPLLLNAMQYRVVATNDAGEAPSEPATLRVVSEPGAFLPIAAKLVGSGAVGSALQGHAVAVSADGTTLIVGAPQDGGGVGAAWIWVRNGGAWTQQGSKLVGTGAVGNAQQGASVAISADGNTAMVGGSADNGNAGAVWVWTRSNGVWSQQGSKLVGSGSVGNARQGGAASLSADGHTAIVGGSSDNSGLGAAWIWTRSAGAWTQHGAKLVGSGSVGNASQGWAVSLSGDGTTAAVGGSTDDGATGAVWVWTRTANAWQQQGEKLVASGAVGAAQQGIALDLSADGNTAVVGGSADSGGVGAAWVWIRSAGVWTQQGSKLIGSGVAGNARFGFSLSVSASGDTALIGGDNDSGLAGAAWVWTRTAGTWTQRGSKVVGAGAVGNAVQGRAVALSADGQTAVVGGAFDSAHAGAVWTFARSHFSQQGPKLVGAGATGTAQQGIGAALSADGTTALIGGSSDNGGAGAVWVWTRSGDVWSQQGTTLVGSGAVGNASQGYSVSLSADGNTALVGGSDDNGGVGAAWIWTRTGDVWTQQGPKLVGTESVGNSRQGVSVSLSADGDTAFVGGPGDNGGAGATWVWTRSGGVWTQSGSKLVGSDAVGNAGQGHAVSVSGDGQTAVVGGYLDSNFVGAAWVWTRSGGAWLQQGAKLVGSGVASSGGGFAYQGFSVSLSADGSTVLVGGLLDANSRGAAWVWTRSDGVWTQQGDKLVGTGSPDSQVFQGLSVSLSASGDTALVGGYLDNSDVGAAWVWGRSGGVWTQRGPKLVGAGAIGRARQGSAVDLSADGSIAIVGGWFDDSNTGASWIFVAPPAGFGKSSPMNAATGQSTSATLQWGASSGAARYEYCVDTVNNSSCDNNWVDAGANTSVGLSGLTAGITYYWQVRAANDAGITYGDGSATTFWSFSTSVAHLVPGAPTSVSGISGNGQVTVSFTGPASTGGSATTGYTVTASPGGVMVSGVASPILVTGLTNGQAYTFTVTATNAVGTGPASTASAAVTPATVPDAPTNVVGVAGDGQVAVSFQAPGNNGGSAITSYTVTAAPGGAAVTGANSPLTLTGLTNGQAYTFTVTATNAVGTGASSTASAAVTPAALPVGFESDVAPRPNGHGTGSITTTDAVQVCRFVAALDAAAPGSEFQRADTAPRSTFGDGRLTTTDCVQGLRDAAGLDAVRPAAGPTAPTNSSARLAADAAPDTERRVELVAVTMGTNQTRDMLVRLTALGVENSLGFSVEFDPTVLTFVSATPGPGAEGAAPIVNSALAGSGQVGILLVRPAGAVWAPGIHDVVELSFRATPSAAGMAAVTFADALVVREVSDENAEALPARFVDGVIELAPSRSSSTGPIGRVDAPAPAILTPLAGAVAVTGWALDDRGVAAVTVYRNCLPFERRTGDVPDGVGTGVTCVNVLGNWVVHLGDAVFVAGARPDIESSHGDLYPGADRAGWGFLLQTRLLPDLAKGASHGGNGPVDLYVVATDFEGHQQLLGVDDAARVPISLTVANADMAVPFGVIDPPAQRDIVAGAIPVFGWALTPDRGTGAVIPADGSTIQVFVDGVPIGRPLFNQCRGSVGSDPIPTGVYCDDDVANIFGNASWSAPLSPRVTNPSEFRNLDAGRGAIGSFVLDTTTLANGPHNIAWSVTDSLGRVAGIGSRNFTVRNPVGEPAATASSITAASQARFADPDSAMGLRIGFDLERALESLEPDADGIYRVAISQLDRMELRIVGATAARLSVGDELRALPAGLSFDATSGTLAWIPGPVMLGSYRLHLTVGERVVVVEVVVSAGRRY